MQRGMGWVCLPEDDSVPFHDVVVAWGSANA